VQGSLTVANDDIAGAAAQKDSRHRHARRTSTRDHNAGSLEFLASKLQRVKQCSQHHNGGPMLIIVKHWNIELFLQTSFDLKTSRLRKYLRD
jgi:hypothetical protein